MASPLASDFQALADNLPTLCWMAYADGNIFWYNRRWYEYTGTSPESQHGSGWQSVHDPALLPKVVDQWQRSVETGQPFEMTFPLRGADGTFRTFLTKAEPHRDEAGAVQRWFGTNVDISTQVAAEKVLRDSEMQLRTFAQAMPNHFWTAPGNGMLDWFNDRVYEYSGAKPGELDGQGWVALVHPDDVPQAAERWTKALANGELYQTEFRLKRADGIYRWHLARAVPIEGIEENTFRWVGTNTDIEEQKLTSEALAHLNANLEVQVEKRSRELSRTWAVSPDILGILNLDGFFETSNPAWQNILGWTPDEIRTTKFFEFIHPDDLPKTYAAWDDAAVGKPALRFENRYRHKHGGWRWLSWVAVPEGDKVYCSARDITPEKEQAAAFEITMADRDRMWRLSTDIMVVSDFGAKMLSVNPAWTTIMGWQEEELIGRQFLEFIHPDDLPQTLAEVGKLSEGAKTFRFENRYRRKDGSYCVIDWTAVPEGEVIHAIGRDVTLAREAAASLARSEEALRQSQKMEAVGQLTGGLAHDFNNLLTGITGSLEMMQSRIAQGRFDEISRYIDVAHGAARRAASLTQRLLAFSRRQTLAPKPTDANRLIHGVEDLIRRTIGPSIELEVVGAGGLWSTLVDPPQLENALLNLCINARDAMPDGGRLTIETANKWLDERAAAERELPPGQYISLCVTDTGTGMTPDVISHAFEPFYTTKPLGMGTGLGLSMIYGFARQSGGQVRIYSELGHGTTMCLYLPRNHQAPEEAASEAADKADSAHGTGETVLVVDDEPSIRMLIGEILEDAGYTAIECADGPSGLRVLQSSAKIDLLITDVGLPGGMNGRQVADAGRVLRPELKVLFITGYAENAVMGNGYLGPGMQVVAKPFTMDGLARKINEIIES